MLRQKLINQEYGQRLNDEKFAGYSGWRLPTLEEAMSLMESVQNEAGMFIDPVFDRTQNWIWTADKASASRAWLVGFYDGYCFFFDVDDVNLYVRAVR